MSERAPAEVRAQPARESRTVRLADAAIRLAILVSGLLAWVWLSELEIVSRRVLASPSDVSAVVGNWIQTGLLWPHLASTLKALGIGLAAGLALGVLVAFLLAMVPVAAVALEPILVAINAIPRAALAPLFLLWFGLGTGAKVAFAVALTFFHTFLSTYKGLLEVDPELVDGARMLGASSWGLVKTVYIPAVGIWVATSLKASVGFAFIGVILGEYLGSPEGVGFLLAEGEARVATDQVIAALLILLVVAAVANVMVTRVEAYFIRWRL